MTKPKKGRRRGVPAPELESRLQAFLLEHPKKTYSPRQLVDKIRTGNSKDSIASAAERLVEKGFAERTAEGEYRLSKVQAAQLIKTAEGYVDLTRSGAGYITCEGMQKDVFVHARLLGSALDGDRVRIEWFLSPHGKPEGRVIEVLQRRTEHFVGVLDISKEYAFVLPDNEKMPVDIYVSLKDIGEAKHGERVVVKVVQWHGEEEGRDSPRGVVTAVLGKTGSNDTEMTSILIGAGFPLNFPQEVLNEMHSIEETISEAEIVRRADFRGVTTFTIDPLTAKDFDDALSIRKVEEGWEVGIHIADVTHYLKPGTAMDQEALRRSTSVYLVDRVLPMLPEKLSNELCSLRPHEDKLTFSAVFIMDETAHVLKEWYGKTIIHSDRRFTYEEAQEIIVSNSGEYAEELAMLNRLAGLLRKKRFNEGAINFESPEVRFRLDDAGKPIELYVKERFDAHFLVEDFMLLANRWVGNKMFSLKGRGEQAVPYIYRVHDTPDMEKVADFSRFAHSMGYKLEAQKPDQVSKAYNKLLKEAEGKPVYSVFQGLAIRTMAKAVYSTDNIGHYGLAFSTYSHFTSPIRRYSDVLAHRILHWHLTRQPVSIQRATLEQQCKHISVMERKAADAERESIRFKQAEYMQEHIGGEFDAIITGVTDFGIFAEIPSLLCEGMVPLDSLPDSYRFDSGSYSLTSHRSGKVIRFGDPIRVRVIGVSLQKRKVEFTMIP